MSGVTFKGRFFPARVLRLPLGGIVRLRFFRAAPCKLPSEWFVPVVVVRRLCSPLGLKG